MSPLRSWGPALSPSLRNAATHGGQMRIPWLGPLVIPSRYGRRFDQGHFVVNDTHLFVSAGVGADAPNLRLWCPPDLLVTDLVPLVRP